MSIMKWNLLLLTLVQVVLVSSLAVPETLECQKKLYTYRVVQSDEQGRQCWDTLSVMSCLGRCVSNEISDWRFPYKRSYHPVCVHSARSRAVAKLRHCEPGAAPGASRYVYLEAESCRCQACSSVNTSCEGAWPRGPQDAGVFVSLSQEDGFAEDNIV